MSLTEALVAIRAMGTFCCSSYTTFCRTSIGFKVFDGLSKKDMLKRRWGKNGEIIIIIYLFVSAKFFIRD